MTARPSAALRKAPRDHKREAPCDYEASRYHARGAPVAARPPTASRPTLSGRGASRKVPCGHEASGGDGRPRMRHDGCVLVFVICRCRRNEIFLSMSIGTTQYFKP